VRVYASVYAGRLTAGLGGRLAPSLAAVAHRSIGAALTLAGRLEASRRPELAGAVHGAATGAFIRGLSAGCLVAGGVAAVGALAAAILLPAQPGGHQPVLAQISEDWPDSIASSVRLRSSPPV
jgi:hypothetical protein